MDLYGIIEDIKALAQAFEHVYFICINRNLNVKTDSFAKQALSLICVPSESYE